MSSKFEELVKASDACENQDKNLAEMDQPKIWRNVLQLCCKELFSLQQENEKLSKELAESRDRVKVVYTLPF